MRRLIILLLTVTCVAGGAEYWQWGWGSYGGSSDLDVARWDWSLINFGGVSANQTTVDRCNRILALNPEHKFVIRIWPLHGGSQKVTLMRYSFEAEARERLLGEARRQIRLILDGIDKPENVVGLTFLEELPGHFTECFMRHWVEGEAPPEELEAWRESIEQAIGEPMTWESDRFRLWWGERYAAALAEIHGAMKSAGEGRLVLYWQATGFNNLSHTDWQPGQPVPKRIVPVTYEQILLPGVCDGIFGYPNKEEIWRKQTLDMVERYACYFFSQVSTIGKMRMCSFDEMVTMARVEHPKNLGLFVYAGAGKEEGFVWNRLPYLDGKSYWTADDRMRRVAWDYGIGRDLIDRYLLPSAGVARNEDRLVVQINNTRDPRWFGGEPGPALLRDLAIMPAGLKRDRLAAGEVWSAEVKTDQPEALLLQATTAGGQVFTMPIDAPVEPFARHRLTRGGDGWIEPRYFEETPMDGALELRPLERAVEHPSFTQGNETVTWADTLLREQRLVIGPGGRARLFPLNLIGDEQQWPEGREFTDGYGVASTPLLPVASGGRYRFSVETKGNALALVFVQGLAREEERSDSWSIFSGRSADWNRREVEIVVPEYAAGSASLRIRLYRLDKEGAVAYRRLSLMPATYPPAAGADVSEALTGQLPKLHGPFTQWSFSTRSDPAAPRALADVCFLSPEAIAELDLASLEELFP